MPSYDICYLSSDDALSCSFTAQCTDDKCACILAHAMRLKSCKGFEVWRGESLIYARPHKSALRFPTVVGRSSEDDHRDLECNVG
jgi:hypothetical protein